MSGSSRKGFVFFGWNLNLYLSHECYLSQLSVEITGDCNRDQNKDAFSHFGHLLLRAQINLSQQQYQGRHIKSNSFPRREIFQKASSVYGYPYRNSPNKQLHKAWENSEKHEIGFHSWQRPQLFDCYPPLSKHAPRREHRIFLQIFHQECLAPWMESDFTLYLNDIDKKGHSRSTWVLQHCNSFRRRQATRVIGTDCGMEWNILESNWAETYCFTETCISQIHRTLLYFLKALTTFSNKSDCYRTLVKAGLSAQLALVIIRDVVAAANRS